MPWKLRVVRVVLLLLLLCPPLWAAVIEPGKSAGSYQLGQDFKQVQASLGAPARVDPSPSDPSTKMYFYRDVAFLVNRQNQVLGITVTSPSYATSGGVGVGSSEQKVRAAFGEGLQRGNGNRTYAERGLGFSFSSGVVTHVYVFKPEGQRPLLGDRLLVAGKRAGELALGLPFATVAKEWGAPEARSELGGRSVVSYPKQGVRLVVSGGKLDGVLVSTGDFITAGGLKVGSTVSEIERVLGPAPSKRETGLFYPKLGIGFVLSGGQVREVQILYPQ